MRAREFRWLKRSRLPKKDTPSGYFQPDRGTCLTQPYLTQGIVDTAVAGNFRSPSDASN
jgi:hypothetical protein